jgi:hypothetical protein
MEMKLEGQCFETVSDVQMELQVVFSSIKENDFHGAFEVWKKDWVAIYFLKETILKEMAPKIKLRQHVFFINFGNLPI